MTGVYPRLARVPAAMPVPDVLRKLLTAPGPSGYEQAAAAVFRDAAAAFADVTHDTRRLDRRPREGDRRTARCSPSSATSTRSG